MSTVPGASSSSFAVKLGLKPNSPAAISSRPRAFPAVGTYPFEPSSEVRRVIPDYSARRSAWRAAHALFRAALSPNPDRACADFESVSRFLILRVWAVSIAPYRRLAEVGFVAFAPADWEDENACSGPAERAYQKGERPQRLADISPVRHLARPELASAHSFPSAGAKGKGRSGRQPRSPACFVGGAVIGGGGGGGGGGGAGQAVPAGTVVPFGQTVGGGGGGGGGGGHGCPAATCVPSGQVCIGGGVVAQAESTAVAETRSAMRLISFSFFSNPVFARPGKDYGLRLNRPSGSEGSLDQPELSNFLTSTSSSSKSSSKRALMPIFPKSSPRDCQ